MSPIWDQTGTKLGPTGRPWGSLEGPWGSLGVPWEVLGGSLEGPWSVLGGYLEGSVGNQTGTQDWSGTGPAPGTQKVPKVCDGRQNQAQDPAWRGTRFGDPLEDPFKVPY